MDKESSTMRMAVYSKEHTRTMRNMDLAYAHFPAGSRLKEFGSMVNKKAKESLSMLTERLG